MLLSLRVTQLGRRVRTLGFFEFLCRDTMPSKEDVMGLAMDVMGLPVREAYTSYMYLRYNLYEHLFQFLWKLMLLKMQLRVIFLLGEDKKCTLF